MARIGLAFIILIILFGCSAVQQPEPDTSNVRIYTDAAKLANCKYLGEIISSEGHWYNYLFISNYNLAKGARDGLRNQAHALGGNVVQVERTVFNYTTSTVYIGNVYDCPDTETNIKPNNIFTKRIET